MTDLRLRLARSRTGCHCWWYHSPRSQYHIPPFSVPHTPVLSTTPPFSVPHTPFSVLVKRTGAQQVQRLVYFVRRSHRRGLSARTGTTIDQVSTACAQADSAQNVCVADSGLHLATSCGFRVGCTGLPDPDAEYLVAKTRQDGTGHGAGHA
eukprot:2795795-Rhodomonas_salina.4